MDKWKKSAREQSRDISENKEKTHHIGKMSYAVIQQEITALRITNPAFRDKKWKKRVESIQHGINDLSNKDNAKSLQNLLTAVKNGEQ